MNKVKFITSSYEITKKFCDLADKAEEIYLSVAWATDNHDAYKTLIKNKSKIKMFFCGIERNLTSPQVIRDFLDLNSFRVVINNELFHHKAYLFKYKDQKNLLTRWETLIGSPNFTFRGFHENLELVQHTVFDSLINLDEELKNALWDQSITPDLEFLSKYEKDHKESNKSERENEQKRNHLKTSFYALSWEEYLEKIQTDQYQSLKGRLKLLKKYSSLLLDTEFENLETIDRKKIAGTYTGKDNDLSEFDTRWFGGMSGAGYFNQNVISKPKPISEAMSLIPKTGEVTKDHYDKFMEKMIPASGYEKDPLAVCTRLLAMLRPDYFFCVTDANKEGLSKDLCFSKSSLRIENYWEKVISPLINSKWWEPRNFHNDLEKEIWASRVALLDILYFKPKS